MITGSIRVSRSWKIRYGTGGQENRGMHRDDPPSSAVRTQVCCGTINGHPFRCSLMPQGEGRHILVVNGELRAAIGVQAGDSVEIALVCDDAPRVVTVPDDFQVALAQAQTAKEYFERISYSRQKEYVDWIEDAKKAETRAARIAKATVRLVKGKPLK